MAPGSAGARPICWRQRLTFSASLPPSPGKVTTETSAASPFGPVAVKLAYRIGDGGLTAQSAGTCQSIFGVSGDAGGAADGMDEVAGIAATALSPPRLARVAVTHLRKLSFSAPTRSTLPRIL